MLTLYKLSILIVCWCIAFDYSIAQPTWQFTPNDVNSLHSKPANQRIPYGKDPLQFGDLRLPSGPGPYPIAILFMAAVGHQHLQIYKIHPH